MTRYDPKRHHRRSIRLQGYDYGRPGAYFVTLCTQHREPFFGRIEGGQVLLSLAGEMVWRWWHELNNKYPVIRTDAAVVMPNHFHGILVIAGQPHGGQPQAGQPHTGQPHARQPHTGQPHVGQPHTGQPHVGQPHTGQPHVGQPHTGQPHRAAPTDGDAHVGATPRGRPNTDDQPATATGPTLGEIVGWFKTMTTNEYIRGVKQQGWPPFPGRVWQRNYYEHIIRNPEELERIRVYIQTNPERWALDRENPQRTGLDELESWIYGPRDDQEA